MDRSVALGYVVRVSGAEIVLNLATDVQSRVYGHAGGLSRLGKPGDLLGVSSSGSVIVLEIASTTFVDPGAVERTHREASDESPLQQFSCRAVGLIRVRAGALEFAPGIEELPFLGAEAIPLGDEELNCVLKVSNKSGALLRLGRDSNDPLRTVDVDVDALLERHAVIVGSTGQGKTHLAVNIVKQLANLPGARIVIFDVNGEYGAAFAGTNVKTTKIGASNGGVKIPYPALGQRGLFRLLMPSERAQAPVLRFAIEALPYIISNGNGAHVVGQTADVLFDDCRQGPADDARQTIEDLRNNACNPVTTWPHFNAIGCLVADAYAIEPAGRAPYAFQRSSYQYSHVSGLIQRVKTASADLRFRDVISVMPKGAAGTPISLEASASRLLDAVFGPGKAAASWRIHIVDLSAVAPDLLHFVVDALLEQLAEESFRRGPGESYPIVLLLEEAHHYIRSQSSSDVFADMPIAHERLAKEGRKFGVSLILCTQRPSELSSTVLAQCGSTFAFRLVNHDDRRIVESNAGPDVSSFADLSALPRGQMIAVGAALNFPLRVTCQRAEPPPKAHEGGFVKRWSESEVTV